jgi:hypothetical protein
MNHPIYRVSAFEIVADFTLRISFDYATEQTIDFRPILGGELYGPLKDLGLFNQGLANGADFDPAMLHDWPENEPAFKELARQWRVG